MNHEYFISKDNCDDILKFSNLLDFGIFYRVYFSLWLIVVREFVNSIKPLGYPHQWNIKMDKSGVHYVLFLSKLKC